MDAKHQSVRDTATLCGTSGDLFDQCLGSSLSDGLGDLVSVAGQLRNELHDFD